jgi:hypothetical protein
LQEAVRSLAESFTVPLLVSVSFNIPIYAQVQVAVFAHVAPIRRHESVSMTVDIPLHHALDGFVRSLARPGEIARIGLIRQSRQ